MPFGSPRRGAQNARLRVMESPKSARVPGVPVKRARTSLIGAAHEEAPSLRNAVEDKAIRAATRRSSRANPVAVRMKATPWVEQVGGQWAGKARTIEGDAKRGVLSCPVRPSSVPRSLHGHFGTRLRPTARVSVSPERHRAE